MNTLFQNPLHERLGTWPLAYIPFGGADYGEVAAIAREIGDGDDGRFYDAWLRAADRVARDAAETLEHGQRATAAALWQKASVFYATAYHPIYGAPLDPRLVAAQAKETAAFDKAMSLRDVPGEKLEIPLGDTILPGWLIRSTSHPNEVRPLLILNNGYDSTLSDIYYMAAVSALARGYHCLIFDGPGQGSALVRNGVPMRADWEVVISAVIDVAVKQPGIDTARIALYGMSLGGYLAPRAASAEPRLAACIADPGLWSIVGGFRAQAVRLGIDPDALQQLSKVDDAILDKLQQYIESDRMMYWTIVQRGYWVHGVTNLRDYLRSAEAFTMEGRAASITCPMLLTHAEDDSLARGAASFYEALHCPKTLLRFSTEEGAGDHCEMGNRTLANRRILDWLDEVLA